MTRPNTRPAPLFPLFLLVSLVLLTAACRPATEGLTLPTPIVDGESATVPVDATTSPLPATGAATAAPTLPATAPPAPTIAVQPTSTTAPTPPATVDAVESAAGYRVAYVELGDTLNVRSGPGATYDIVAELPPDATGLTVDETSPSLIAGSSWVWVDGEDASGWVNSRYLTESVSEPAFCSDPEVATILTVLEQAIGNRDGAQLAGLVHPDRGLRLRHAWWNDEVLVPGDEVVDLFRSDTAYDWGMEGGSGLPIRGTFSEVLLPLLDGDLLPATEQACNEVIHGPTAGMTILPEGYQPVPFVSLFRPAPGDVEFDWGTWAVGIEQWEGQFYLSYLVHYAYEI